MQPGQPSRTAFGAARHRAAHQILERGSIFRDPLALPILGVDAETVVSEAGDDPWRRRLRLFIAVRTRFAEDTLAAAVERGVRQLVVLGAGLDTYAYRNGGPAGSAGNAERRAERDGGAGELRIFEVDHPATQAWKRQRLADAAIAIPANLTYAPVDFERETLAGGLAAAGFDSSQGSFFTWLGVVPYLSEPAVFATLSYIATRPGGAQVVFDYGNPPDAQPDPDGHGRAFQALAERVAAAGEPLRSAFETAALCERLKALGFGELEDLGPRQIAARYFPDRPSRRKPSDHGGHVLHAATG